MAFTHLIRPLLRLAPSRSIFTKTSGFLTVSAIQSTRSVIGSGPSHNTLTDHSHEHHSSLSHPSGQCRCYRVRNALQLRCKHCMYVVRGGKLRVICKENPRHKQRQK